MDKWKKEIQKNSGAGIARIRLMTAEERKADLNQWMIRSTDGGRTWSPRNASVVNSPHGPVQLRDGRLLYAGEELWTGAHRIGVCESADDGVTWNWLAEIPARAGDKASEYHELHAVECMSGRLVVHIRNENKTDDNETLQSESTDGGKTWSAAHRLLLDGRASGEHLRTCSASAMVVSS